MLNTSSCKRTPEGYQVSNMNSVDSQINMTPTLTLGSFAAVEQDKENKMPSHHASEVRVKTRRNKLKSRSKGQMDISNEGTGGRPSNLVNGSNQTVQQHYLNAMVTMPSVDEDLSKQDEIPLKKSVDSSSAKYLQLNEIANGDDKGKEGDLTHVLSVGAAVDQTKSKSKKKHKMEVSSKRHIELEHCEHNFVDYFVPNEGSHNPAVSMVDMSSKKSNARKKAKTSRKIQTSQLQQDETTDLDNLGKKLKDHRDQPSVQRLKKGDVMYKQSKHTNSSGDGNCDGDNLVTKDEAPSDSAEDTPYQLRRYKVVRKLLNRRSEKVMNSNFEKSLAVPSGRTFDDVSDSDMNPEEMMTKTTALKSRMETNSSASDADSDEQDETNEKADGNLSELSRLAEIAFSVILKSSSMYKKAKLGVLQSELEAETGSQPVDVVLETQPEPSSS
ncbi:hypothetical protein HPP92_007646 [Vanilla planifolia]|uniref:Uncharacterized protein n=1 Tax=Vanilla planifolia TaxID=51239 RepID=A0A835RHX7_VANPL|nr:hypothetical protein HPP92_007646 [Vanilla planifolia]